MTADVLSNLLQSWLDSRRRKRPCFLLTFGRFSIATCCKLVVSDSLDAKVWSTSRLVEKLWQQTWQQKGLSGAFWLARIVAGRKLEMLKVKVLKLDASLNQNEQRSVDWVFTDAWLTSRQGQGRFPQALMDGEQVIEGPGSHTHECSFGQLKKLC